MPENPMKVATSNIVEVVVTASSVKERNHSAVKVTPQAKPALKENSPR
jgi:hypothetical protein